MDANKSGTWTIDASHTVVEFAVRHMMISTVKGRFGDVKGSVVIPEVGTPNVDVTISAASIDTRNEQRDNHLKSGDFFDVEKFPELSFKSTGIAKTTDGYKLTGDLTIRGITRPITLAVTEEGMARDPWGNERLGFNAAGKLDRKEFGLTWNAALEAGGVLVGDEVKLSIDTQLVKPIAAAKAA